MNTHITDAQVDDAIANIGKIVEAAQNSNQAGEDAIVCADAAPLMLKALRATYAWFYCEQHNLGSFDVKGTLCAHSEYMTAKAIAAADGRDFDREYKGYKKMFVWPHVRLDESDATTAEALIKEAFEHERENRK